MDIQHEVVAKWIAAVMWVVYKVNCISIPGSVVCCFVHFWGRKLSWIIEKYNFRKDNFHELQNREICKSFLPRKFPGIREFGLGITKWYTGCNQQPLVTKMLCNKQECSPGVLNHDDRLLLELQALSPFLLFLSAPDLLCYFFFVVIYIGLPGMTQLTSQQHLE